LNYQNLYNQLIESRKLRLPDIKQYYENHHILPSSIRGSNKKENLIALTPKEHFIAHLLLFKFTTGKDKVKMGYALHMMTMVVNEHQDYRRINSRKFSKLKLIIYKTIKGSNHPSFGKKMSQDFKEKIRHNQLGTKNSMYGKKPWNFGKTKENDPIVKIISEKQNGKIVPREKTRFGVKNKKETLDESRLNYSKAKKGQVPWNSGLKNCYKEEVLIRMSQKKKGIPQEKIQCPYCGKEGGITMHRWHFENCKFKDRKE